MTTTIKKLANGLDAFGKEPKPAEPVRKARVKKFIRVVEEELPTRRVSKNSLDSIFIDAAGRVEIQKQYGGGS